MRFAVIRGIIDRRILVNYRIDPQVLAKTLPHPFRPMHVSGMGMGGVCLIRLRHLRPRFLPTLLGLSSESVAHRIAVEWEEHGRRRQGVFIPRRDTSSWPNSTLGGCLFPGVQHHAHFEVQEQDEHYRILMDSDDRQTHVLLNCHVSPEFPKSSIFGSLQEVSAFFKEGSLGYSTTGTPGRYEGLELRSFNWEVRPLVIEQIESSFFENRTIFPPGSVEFDCALLMREIEHEWHGRESLVANPRRESACVRHNVAIRPC